MAYPNWIRIAHRGASGSAPENTMAAFSKALEIGVDGVELDVHASADGKVVVMHDGSLDRTTNMQGKISELPWQQIQTADAGSWFGSEFAGEQVPQLCDALDLICKQAIAVVEVKDGNAASAVASAIQRTGTAQGVTIISFIPEVLVEMRTLLPQVPSALLIGSLRDNSPQAQAVECVSRTCEHAANALDIHHGQVTPEFSYELRRRGVGLWVWTVDDVGRMRELVSMGVQGITSNNPERFAEVM